VNARRWRTDAGTRKVLHFLAESAITAPTFRKRSPRPVSAD
jgi:hypothetical protein